MQKNFNILFDNKKIIICILQIITIFNALQAGWEVKRINEKTLELSKETHLLNEFNFSVFLDNIISYKLNQ